MTKRKLPAPETLNRLKAVMAEKERSREWLADKMKVSETTVSNWCQNHIQSHLSDLKKISKLLDVDIRELIVSTKPRGQ